MDMSTNSDNQSNLNCIYRLDAMPKSSWHDGWTMDDIRVPLNRQGRWTFTCHNSLCESDLYKEAVGKFNDFVASLVHSFSGIGNPVWWYRGQASAKWPVLPGVLRDDFVQSIYFQLPVHHHGNLHTPKQIYYERMLLSDFIREGGSLVGERYSEEDWYVKAQHHGLPTRLLDWTMSPQIALWMALDSATQSEEDGVIIAIVPKVIDEKKEIVKRWNRDRLCRLFKCLSQPPDTTKIEEEYHDLFDDEAILPFSPNYFSPRQINQQSMFTLHTPPSLESKTIANVGINDFYECHEFVVEAGLKELYKTYLYVNGMRRWNVYPDLDNLAKGIRDAHVLMSGSCIHIKDLFVGN